MNRLGNPVGRSDSVFQRTALKIARWFRGVIRLEVAARSSALQPIPISSQVKTASAKKSRYGR